MIYAVVEFNQASHQPGPTADLFDTKPDAVSHRDLLNTAAAEAGRRERYKIFTLEEIEEDQEWEWGVLLSGTRNTITVIRRGELAEREARASLHEGDTLLRRPLGTQIWQEMSR